MDRQRQVLRGLSDRMAATMQEHLAIVDIDR